MLDYVPFSVPEQLADFALGGVPVRPGAHMRKFFYDDLVCKRKDLQKVLVAVQLGAWTKGR